MRTVRKAIWARALGRRAPITVGAISGGMRGIIEEILAEATPDAGDLVITTPGVDFRGEFFGGVAARDG